MDATRALFALCPRALVRPGTSGIRCGAFAQLGRSTIFTVASGTHPIWLIGSTDPGPLWLVPTRKLNDHRQAWQVSRARQPLHPSALTLCLSSSTRHGPSPDGALYSLRLEPTRARPAVSVAQARTSHHITSWILPKMREDGVGAGVVDGYSSDARRRGCCPSTRCYLIQHARP